MVRDQLPARRGHNIFEHVRTSCETVKIFFDGRHLSEASSFVSPTQGIRDDGCLQRSGNRWVIFSSVRSLDLAKRERDRDGGRELDEI